MKIDEAYNIWATQYDTNENKTRDLEEIAARKTLAQHNYTAVLELGCGTGKNTAWLAEHANSVVALDFSEQMLLKAKEKITSPKVQFRRADLTKPWNVEDNSADLITCSLVLEHIEKLNFIFSEAAGKLQPRGKFFICELHPARQYGGSKAKFEDENGLTELEVYTHHVSDFTGAALRNGFKVIDLQEWFDDGDRTTMPRLISFVFEK